MNEFVVSEEYDKNRIDKYLSNVTDYSRSKIVKLIENNLVLVDDEVIKKSYTVNSGDIVTITGELNEEINILPENIKLDIIYEDDDVIVVNKPSGMVVHPAPGNYSKTLVNALLYHTNTLSKDNIRPGIVHRIDAYTSGLLMVAKNEFAHNDLALQLKNKTTTRKYIALVWGVINHDTGTIDAPIGRSLTNRQKMCVTDINSKDAITHFKVLKRYDEVTLIECVLETGRTHQIRVHMDYIKHPIVNDPTYGKRKMINEEFGQMLHAKTLGFVHPRSKKYLEFSVNPPEEFEKILNSFN